MRSKYLGFLFFSIVIIFGSCSKPDDEINSKKFTVSFESNGGTSVPYQTVNGGGKVTRPNDPIKSGVVFIDWYKDEALTVTFDFNTVINTNIKLYAKWNWGYHIHFKQTGDTQIDTQIILAGKKAIRPNNPLRKDYYFEGWYEDTSFEIPFDFNLAINKDKDVYAKWGADFELYSLTNGYIGASKDILTIENNVATLNTILYPIETHAPYLYRNKIRTIAVPKDIKEIGVDAFFGCSDIEKIILPQGLEIINERAFFSCSLKELSLPESVISIKNAAFSYSSLININLPSGLKSIAENLFSDCRNLKSIIIPNKVTSIGSGAFINCDSLLSVSLPEGLETIDTYAFWYCGLRSIILPESLISIGGGAFSQCDLESIVIPSKIKTIENSTFSYSSLKNVILNEGLLSIGYDAFHYSEIESIIIPNSVTTIYSRAFENTPFLKKVVLPNNLKVINEAVFNYCAIESIDIPNSVIEIDGYAFKNCPFLKQITLPSSVASLGGWAFKDCYDLGDKSVEILNPLLRVQVLSNPEYYGLIASQIK